MQGWAIIENASGADWTDVELTLVGSNPVTTFRQSLYDKYYVDRLCAGRGAGTARRRGGTITTSKGKGDDPATGRCAPAAHPAPLEPAGPAPASTVGPTTSPLPARGCRRSRQVAAESTEAATSVIFTLSNAVTAGSGQSLTVPILDREVPAQMISFYQPHTHPTHPLSAVKLTNRDGHRTAARHHHTVRQFQRPDGLCGRCGADVLPVGEDRILSMRSTRR